MPVSIDQLHIEITEPAEATPEFAMQPAVGSAHTPQCLRSQTELKTDRAERLQVD
jgi:hypothetical protein